MTKGLLKGVLWGAGAGVGAVVLFSILGQLGTQRSTERSVEALLQDNASGQKASDDGATRSVAARISAQEEPAPEPDTLAGLLPDTLKSSAVPQTGSASDLQSTQQPPNSALSGIADPQSQAPTVEHGNSAALEIPATEPELSISTEPAQPLAPEATPQTTAFEQPDPVLEEEPKEAVEQPAIDDTPPEMVTDIGIPDAPETVLEAAPTIAETSEQIVPTELSDNSRLEVAIRDEQVPVAEKTADKEETLAALTPEKTDPPVVDPLAVEPLKIETPVQPAADTSESEETTNMSPEAQAPAQQDVVELPKPEKGDQAKAEGDSAPARVIAKLVVDAPSVVAPPPPPTSVVTKIEQAPETPAALPLPEVPEGETDVEEAVATEPAQPPEPATNVDDVQKEQVRVNRLPTLGAPVEPEVETVPSVELEPILEGDEEQRPVEQFAAVFDNPDAKPLMSILLMDDGVDMAAPIYGLDALKALPYPVSFAVDALLPDAAQRMQAYRAAGFEVLATVDLPVGAGAADAEVNLAVALDVLPEAVGVLEGVRTGVQTTSDAGRQVAKILAQTGHGFVTQNKGLNTVQKLAARDGVPSAIVFRDFDGKGQNEAVIRRSLDQGAFRAGQEGAVVMLGRLRQETVSALVVWALQDRASTIALSPVSPVLRIQ